MTDTMSGSAQAMDPIDLSQACYTPPDTPAWARVEVPDWIAPHVGKAGAAPHWREEGPYGAPTAGVDRYQANHFVWYRPETAAFLYEAYTPLTVGYRAGTLPAYEATAAHWTAGCASDTERALALLTRAMPALTRHPSMPPIGKMVAMDRNLDDEGLLAARDLWCNEQARVFIRLCQVCGIPARMIHLFGLHHTVAEFHADGRWALADASGWHAVPGADGLPLSAAACHDGGEGQLYFSRARHARTQELLALTDDELFPGHPEKAQAFRRRAEALTPEELSGREIAFGVMNVPLP